MKIENFKAGTWTKQFQYSSFSPSPINHDWTWEDERINVLLEKAAHAIGELNAFSLIVPDVDRFITMHIAKEANLSSRIEGTQTSLGEAMMPAEAIEPEKRDDWQEVRNYIDAINSAIGELTKLPLSNRLLRKTHAILMSGVRGKHKQPGEIRTQQNWIGGSGPMDAAFVPPAPGEIPALMSDLEKFIHNDTLAVPNLVRAAITHYQFETIHPFNDGNGRIGRLLITLILVSKGILAKPSLYLSDFFERNRSAYIDALARVHTANDLNHWVRFFLGGVVEVAGNGCNTFQKILKLRNELEEVCLNKMGRRHALSRKAIHVLYHNPVISAEELKDSLAISLPTANALLKDFCKLGILEETTGKQRFRLFSFKPYLSLFVR